jgi:FkbM family methyltransferase
MARKTRISCDDAVLLLKHIARPITSQTDSLAHAVTYCCYRRPFLQAHTALDEPGIGPLLPDLAGRCTAAVMFVVRHFRKLRMMSDKDELLVRVRELYARLHAGSLNPADIVDAKTANFTDYGHYIERIFTDYSVFLQHFSNFQRPYAVFRVFGAEAHVLDVGAHWGYSAAAMRHKGCKARITSIEAAASNASALDWLAANDRFGYSWINVAVGRAEAMLTFYTPVINGHVASGLTSTGATLDDFFASHIVSMTDAHPPQGGEKSDVIKLLVQKVRCATIDSLLVEAGIEISRVAAIKMDVEGHEASALAGAAGLFSSQKPLLMLEEANRNPRSTAQMMEYGYFHCEEIEGVLRPHLAYSFANDGFWVHPDRVASYKALGLFEGETPSPEQMAVFPEADNALRKSPLEG